MGQGFNTLLFTCAICQHEVRDFPDRNGRDRQMTPVCRYCEGFWGSRPPQHGNFMDRRKAAQISALANALHDKARHKQWSASYGPA